MPSFLVAAPNAGNFKVKMMVEAPRPEFMRPAEFGPLLLPLEVVERLRTAVFRDQMKALAGRFAQQAEDWQNEFVERWGEHWSHDYVAWLTA